MVRSREDLNKFFSDEIIDHAIEDVRDAKDGDILFFMDRWENEDFVVSVLSYSGVDYFVSQDEDTRYYIKGRESQT